MMAESSAGLSPLEGVPPSGDGCGLPDPFVPVVEPGAPFESETGCEPLLPGSVEEFRFSQGDKFQLDFDDNLNSSDRPRSLFNAGRVKGRTLEQAAKNAYRDKDQATENAQKLLANQAVFFNWRGGTYLSVNDRSQEFAANQDLLINVTGIQFKPGDTRNGTLNVANYFA
ncbi:bluetail domain-containing putative surface protein [Leptolyngbya sp. 7M]|uniref:bluetail domain-containing putative surface protein n=1 Tax=Leptolyngbya sp. 7M TaxID=2812896 RepID=UPI001B8D3141|nr:bluetail domain-containing putative surface protein [Leptolyngbya sp. 7M]QYO62156.1 hypothetical protein JVX88_18760 [Leptolyngbya sp. 7M]